MSMTDRLDVPEIDPNQAEKAVTANEAFNALADSLAKLLVVPVTGDEVLDYEATEGGDKTGLQFAVIELTGTAGGSHDITIPEMAHLFGVINSSTSEVTITAGGTGVTFAAGDTGLVYCDGTDVFSLGSSGTSTGGGSSVSVPQRISNANTTLTLADASKHIYRAQADTTGRTWTIPANASVAFPIGSTVTFVNDGASGNVTIAITSDTLVLQGAGSTGSRTLAPQGMATALKVTATRWVITGTNLT